MVETGSKIVVDFGCNQNVNELVGTILVMSSLFQKC